MDVFTYYEDIGRGTDPLIPLWHESWRKHGWNPTVLGLAEAELHPDFELFVKGVSRLPTVNDRKYEMSCYIRHLAMWQVGGGLLTDYDVMNYGFKPDSMVVIAEAHPEPNHIGTLDDRGVPCAIYGTQEGYAWFCSQLMTWPASNCSDRNGKPHVSDMVISQRLGLPREGICIPYTLKGWEKAALVHYSTKRCNGVEKYDLIRSVRSP